MSQRNWIPSNDELETFGLLTFDSGSSSTGGTTENTSIDDEEEDMPPSQG